MILLPLETAISRAEVEILLSLDSHAFDRALQQKRLSPSVYLPCRWKEPPQLFNLFDVLRFQFICQFEMRTYSFNTSGCSDSAEDFLDCLLHCCDELEDGDKPVLPYKRMRTFSEALRATVGDDFRLLHRFLSIIIGTSDRIKRDMGYDVDPEFLWFVKSIIYFLDRSISILMRVKQTILMPLPVSVADSIPPKPLPQMTVSRWDGETERRTLVRQ